MSQLLPSNILIDKMVDAGYERTTAELVVNESFRLIAETLQSESMVKVKGLGDFVFTEQATVAFIAEEDLAKAINEPFSMFEPIEIDESIEVDDLTGNEADLTSNNTPVNEDSQIETTIEGEPVAEIIDSTDIVSGEINLPATTEKQKTPDAIFDNATSIAISEQTTESETETDTETEAIPETETEAIPETETEAIPETETEQPIDYLFYDDVEKKTSRHRVLWLLLGLLLGLVGGYFIGVYHSNIIDFCNGIFNKDGAATESPLPASDNPIEELTDLTLPVEEETLQHVQDNTENSQEDSSEEHANNSNAEPVITETVKPGNFLATMARRHYGRYEFWVYIYKENESALGHPDLIENGTVVVIPPASKYGIDKTDTNSIKKAEQLATQIYAKF